MKKSLYILVAASTAAMLLASCAKEVESVPTEDNNGPVYITASIDPETKSTLAEGNGAFAFSSGDRIMINNNGSESFTGTTSETGNSVTFEIAEGFNASHANGLAVFPARMVYTMTSTNVSFMLPSSYDYSEVGDADPDAAKVPCPMMGYYYKDPKTVTFKQVASVIRFRVTNIAAGSLSFTFPTKVTGQVKPLVVRSDGAYGDDGGILASNFQANLSGNTITVNDVPEVTLGNYIYITLPVPTGTVPENILVTNTPADPALRIRMQNLTPAGAVALKRAGGRKVGGVSPAEIPIPSFTINASGDKVVLAPGNLMAKIGGYNTNGVSENPRYGYATSVSEWKFGEYFECVGSNRNEGNYLFANYSTDCVGKWVDLFTFQGASIPAGNAVHGLVMSNDDGYTSWYGSVAGENAYAACWRTDENNTSTPSGGKIHISNGGDYTWRPMNADEMDYLFRGREGATVSTNNHARSGRATVAGVKGLLVFPDGITWQTTAQGGSDNCGSVALNTAMTAIADANEDAFIDWGSHISEGKDSYNFVISFSSSDFVTLSQCGIVFLPTSGTLSDKAVNAVGSACQLETTSSPDNGVSSDIYFFAAHSTAVWTKSSGSHRRYGRAVRLVRDIDEKDPKETDGVGRGSHFTWDE